MPTLFSKKLPDAGFNASVRVIYSTRDKLFYMAWVGNNCWVWSEVSESQVIDAIKAGWTVTQATDIRDYLKYTTGE